MAWHNNVNVVQTFASNDSQNAWVNLPGVGWKKIKTGANNWNHVGLLSPRGAQCNRARD
jgi:hypothetical protein